MRIRITADDIHAGNIFDCDKCPMAIAMTRAFGVRVKVGWESATWYDAEGHTCDMALPKSAVKWLSKAQDGKFAPFSFSVPDRHKPEKAAA